MKLLYNVFTMSIKLSLDDQIHFKKWLGLNLNSISWEGRYLDEFNQVWGLVFEPNNSIETQFEKIKCIDKLLTQGPIISWFRWLNQKFICFLYIYKDLSISEIVDYSNKPNSTVSLILRDFFIERYPHMEDLINEKFQVGSKLSKNLSLKFSDISKALLIENEIEGSSVNDVMIGLEVTLYSDWKKLKTFFIESNGYYKNTEQVLKDKNFLRRQVRFFRDLAILFFIGGLFILLIKEGNEAYEKYLVEKISLFSPKFFWLDKNLSFKTKGFEQANGLDIKLDELEELEKLESKKVFEDIKVTRRFEVESDVVLTSVDSMPKDFKEASLEQSNYEEVKKGGYRNSRYGRRKAYRVMMTSVDPSFVKEELIKTLKKYKVKQVDNVKPGTSIPGGIYFNLYVPRGSLKKFLSKVSSYEDQSTILESKTVFGGPPGMDKVFIWIKSI